VARIAPPLAHGQDKHITHMKQTEYDLLKMRHARAVANIYQYAAQANREAALDGWLFDWAEAMREAHVEAVRCETELSCAINGITMDELAQNTADHFEAMRDAQRQ